MDEARRFLEAGPTVVDAEEHADELGAWCSRCARWTADGVANGREARAAECPRCRRRGTLLAAAELLDDDSDDRPRPAAPVVLAPSPPPTWLLFAVALGVGFVVARCT